MRATNTSVVFFIFSLLSKYTVCNNLPLNPDLVIKYSPSFVCIYLGYWVVRIKKMLVFLTRILPHTGNHSTIIFWFIQERDYQSDAG